MLRVEDSLAGIGTKPIRGRLHIEGITVPTDIHWKVSTGGTMAFHLRPYDPAKHESIRRLMASGDVKSLNVTLRGDYIPARASLAVLRIAYLIMFEEFGYSYILSPAAGVIRSVFTQYANPPAQVHPLSIQVLTATPAPVEPWQLFLLDGGVGVMVVITLRTDAKHQFVTFMPSPGIAADSVYEVLCDAAKGFADRGKS
jgi:hypothetical protein